MKLYCYGRKNNRIFFLNTNKLKLKLTITLYKLMKTGINKIENKDKKKQKNVQINNPNKLKKKVEIC